jgi:hypothetical protein
MKSWSTEGTYGRGYAILSNDGDTHGYGDEASCIAIGNEAMIWYKNVRSLALLPPLSFSLTLGA